MALSINIKDTIVHFNQAKVMGIINATPDSFYKASRTKNMDNAITKAESMLNDGADFLDIGGYSSRPGAPQVSLQEELDRVIPVIQTISANVDAIISIDTFRSEVAREAVNHGASLVNDISGGEDDSNMLATIAELDVPYIFMHKQGSIQDMQTSPHYDNVVEEVFQFLLDKKKECMNMGVVQLIADPGFGFGKSLAHNYTLLNELEKFKELDIPLLVGISRKSMINKILDTKAIEALNGTTFLHALCLHNGANILRVHDVKEAKQACLLWQAYADLS
ncbi:MAG: dihydropteroate synthase [Bacteroidia bacterium]